MDNRPKLLLMSSILVMAMVMVSVGRTEVSTAEPGKVESVEVQLNIEGEIYEGLRERMEFSIGRVGEKILLSHSLFLLTANRASVESAIFKVFSKTLVGFKMEKVNLFPGKHSKIVVQLTPTPPFVSEVALNLEIKGVAPEIASLFENLSQIIEQELNRILAGLPVDSVSWAEGIINQAVRYLVEREFPGYECRFSLEPGMKTELNLALEPIEPVIKNIRINYVSSSFPVWLVKQKVKRHQNRFDILKGLPVDFLRHYQSRLEKYLTEYLNSLPEMDKVGLQVRLGIAAGITTRIKVETEAQKIQAKVEARCFTGSEDDFENVQFYLGYRTDSYEVFARHYWGEYPGGRLKVGCRWPLSATLTGGFEYEFDNRYRNLWFHNQFERGDYFDLKIGIDGSPNEATIGVFLNNHLNLELVAYEDQFGMQLMFHF